MLGNQVVQNREQQSVRSVRPDDKWRDRAGDILLWDVNRHVASVGSRMAGGHDQLGGVGGIWCSENTGVPRDAWVDFAVGRIHSEVVNSSLRHARLHSRFRRGVVCGAEDEISVGLYWSVRAVR